MLSVVVIQLAKNENICSFFSHAISRMFLQFFFFVGELRKKKDKAFTQFKIKATYIAFKMSFYQLFTVKVAHVTSQAIYLWVEMWFFLLLHELPFKEILQIKYNLWDAVN